MIKPLVRRAIGNIGASRTLRALALKRLGRCATIVYYHFAGTPKRWLDVHEAGCTLERFDRHLAELRQEFEIVPLEQVLDWNAARDGVPERPLMAVTFDDGLDLLRSGAAEILARHGVRATAFVVTACVGNNQLMWRHKLSAILAEAGEQRALAEFARLAPAAAFHAARSDVELLSISLSWPPERKEELADALWHACSMRPLEEFLEAEQPYFTWDGLRAWRAAGHAAGLHTRTHPDCSRLSAELLEDEIAHGARQLRDALGLTSVAFSYPFGRRAEPTIAKSLVDRGVISCALGIRGCSPWGTPAHSLERAGLDGGAKFALYGRALVAPPR